MSTTIPNGCRIVKPLPPPFGVDVVFDIHDDVCVNDLAPAGGEIGYPMSKHLVDARERADISQARLAELVGTSQSQIQRLESGARRLTVEWAYRLAPVLNCDPADLVPDLLKKISSQKPPPLTRPSASKAIDSVITVPVRGIVAAGMYMESDTEVTEDIPIPAAPGAERSDQFAFRVSGTSMNARIPDGAYVICVPYWMTREVITHEDTVVVERRRGGLVERTCKEVNVTPTHYELWPRSTDPKWQTPIRIERQGDGTDTDGVEIEIVGRVIGVYLPM